MVTSKKYKKVFDSVVKNLFSDNFIQIEKKLKTFFRFLHVNRKKILEACNANQMNQPIIANEAWYTRHLNKYDWLAIS